MGVLPGKQRHIRRQGIEQRVHCAAMLERPDLAEKLHPSLAPLLELAGNLRWSWHPPAARLLERVDPEGWARSRGNPVALLRALTGERIHALQQDQEFQDALRNAVQDLERYLSLPSWFAARYLQAASLRVAYFSAEYGLAACMPNYAGGLGILAGDHLRAASDLGVPLDAVGLAYRFGYFRQGLDPGGGQTEAYDAFAFEDLPVNLVRDEAGAPVTVDLPFPGGRLVRLQIWRAQVGRVTLHLLDTDLPENDPQDRAITRHLYGGDQDTRVRQEIVLGIGGVRALGRLDIAPGVFHLNEGHSAFLILERIREAMRMGLDFETARQRVAASSIFTTHTPEPAGFDLFGPDLLWHYIEPYLGELGISFERFLALGTAGPPDGYRPLNMALFAIRNTVYRNAVSRLHGRVARSMWHREWPGVPEDQVPIGSVTNGVHLETWVSPEIGAILDAYLKSAWRETEPELSEWDALDHVPDAAIWNAHMRAKQRLIEETRRRSLDLNPHGLVIGFARRFAPYKRATLILRDRERLGALLGNPARPVVILFSGKAHPQNQEGKELIREIHQVIREAGASSQLVFLEDYDMELARQLVQGVDVWLNTPRRPQEASGTSGMKAAVNGVLNLSVLDGWWAEGYRPDVGWAIGDGEESHDHAAQDDRESRALYDLLETRVIPMFYDRGEDGIPHRWTGMMKASIRFLAPVYNTHRMVREYAEGYYLPAGKSVLLTK
jgi:glycogen phosphorylase